MKRFPEVDQDEAARIVQLMVGLSERHHDLAPGVIASPNRKAKVTRARQWAWFAAREAGCTAPQIQRAMGIPHLSTVEHGLRVEAGRRWRFTSVRA